MCHESGRSVPRPKSKVVNENFRWNFQLSLKAFDFLNSAPAHFYHSIIIWSLNRSCDYIWWSVSAVSDYMHLGTLLCTFYAAMHQSNLMPNGNYLTRINDALRIRIWQKPIWFHDYLRKGLILPLDKISPRLEKSGRNLLTHLRRLTVHLDILV